jgi:hypothetical protein
VTVRIEVFAAPGCGKCAAARDELRAIAFAVLGEANVAWREVDVFEEIEYAVSLGVLGMPAIAVNGELKFPSLPAAGAFRRLLAALEVP